MQTRNTVIFLAANHEAPLTFWQKAIDAPKANVFGMSLVIEDTLITQMVGDPDPTAEGMFGLRQSYLTQDMVVHLGHYPEGALKEDLQPFVMGSPEDEKIDDLAVFVDGDFTHYGHEGQQRTNEWYMLENKIFPQLQMLYEYLDNDADKVFGALRKKANENTILDAIGSQGNVLIVNKHGKMELFTKGNPPQKFAWGWTTQTHGHIEDGVVVEEEDDEEETIQVEVKTPGQILAEKVAAAKGKSTPTPAPTAKKNPTGPGSVPSSSAARGETTNPNDNKTKLTVASTTPVKDLKTTTADVTGPPQFVKMELPKKFSDKKTMCNRLLGHLIKDLDKATHINVPFAKVPKDELPMELRKFIQPSSAVAAAVAPAGTTETSKPDQERFPDIPVKQIEAFAKTFNTSAEMTEIRNKKLGMPTAVEIQDMETRVKSFVEATGGKISMIETFHISEAGLDVLIRDYPALARTLLSTYRIGYMKSYRPLAAGDQHKSQAAA